MSTCLRASALTLLAASCASTPATTTFETAVPITTDANVTADAAETTVAAPTPDPIVDFSGVVTPASFTPTQEEASDGGSEAAQANNPIANLTAFNIQNYYIEELAGSPDSANQFWFRFAKPVEMFGGTWLIRASLPLLRLPSADLAEVNASGIGDSNIFAAYLLDTGDPAVSAGIGPLVGIPTGSQDELGNDQWSIGLAAVYFDGRNPVYQYGGLVTWQTKMGGSDRLDDVNFMTAQPFGFAQLGDGLYIRSAPLWTFDLDSGNYNVPVSLGIGKVVRAGTTVLNFFIEPQWAVLSEGPGQPEYQIYAALNMQFY